jgi:hypothetical protein
LKEKEIKSKRKHKRSCGLLPGGTDATPPLFFFFFKKANAYLEPPKTFYPQLMAAVWLPLATKEAGK